MELTVEILTTIAALFIWQKSCIFGELTVFQSPTYMNSSNNASYRILTCVSEDDSGALIWNDDLHLRDEYNDKRIQVADTYTNKSTIGCPFNNYGNCTRQWMQTTNWIIENSLQKAMGPVMDKRWEDFEEITFEPGNEYRKVKEVNRTGSIVFSVRGKTDAHIILCETTNQSDPCFRIAIGGSENKVSLTTRYTRNENSSKSRTWEEIYRKQHDQRKHSDAPLSQMEWRTFILQWSDTNREITVFNETGQMISKRLKEWKRIKYLYVSSSSTTLFRFHLYNYLYATEANETLLSPQISVTDSELCIEMLTGLCAGCAMHIHMLDERQSPLMIGTVQPEENTRGDDLPMWQHVRLKKTVNDRSRNPIRFQMVTVKLQHDPNPLWAVADVRICMNETADRRSKQIVYQHFNEEGKYFWPNVGCQQLSYKGGSVISFTSDVKTNLKHAPARILNLRSTSVSDKEVVLQWDQPKYENRTNINYTITIKLIQLLGCDKQQNSTLYDRRTITARINKLTLNDLHPYAKYNVSINVATNEPGPATSILFTTKASKIPTSVVSKLKLKGETIEWDLPEDCTTISGPFEKVRLIFQGISSRVQNFTDSRETGRRYYLLGSRNQTIHEATKYKVQVYVIRNWGKKHNETAFIELSFVTKPKAPQPVRDLEIHEANIEEKNIYSRVKRETSSNISRFIDDSKGSEKTAPAISNVQQNTDTGLVMNLKWPSVILVLLLAIFALLSYRMYRKIQRRKRLNSQCKVSSENKSIGYNKDAVHFKPRLSLRRRKLKEKTFSEEYKYILEVEEFEEYVKNAAISGRLRNQYAMLPNGLMQPCDYGKLPQNRKKNRYGNVIPYDETRVILEKLPDDPHSDYINANYIKGYNTEKAYIATQWPKRQTINDFWRMIWQEDVKIISLLSKVGKGNCEEYWPEIGSEKKYGDVLVSHIEHQIFPDYTFRTFSVTCNEQTRKIQHLHHTAWSEHTVPTFTYSIVSYLKKLLARPPEDNPVVIQSNAGSGRSGIIILSDICYRKAKMEGVMDVFATAQEIRTQRANMINNYKQYLLAHLVIAECLLAPETAVLCDEDLPKNIQRMKTQSTAQLKWLHDSAWQDNVLHPTEGDQPLPERNLAKNRYQDIAPGGENNVILLRYPIYDETSAYISAVYVDGYKSKRQYVATQLPLPSTLSDFWRMISERKVQLIVMLQLPDLTNPTYCEIFEGREFKPVPYLTVTDISQSEEKYFTSQKLKLSDISENPTQVESVTILKCKRWQAEWKGKPPPPDVLIELWQASEKIPREGPTVVVCHDGVTGCGRHLALSFLLERMSVERVCDVCLAIRAVRRARPQFVQSLEDIEFLYDAALKYSQRFATYANFQ